jgi:hypothetical protein
MEKELLTPGRLYARLSDEFRTRQIASCGGCRMPMVYLREGPGEGLANWIVESSSSACEPCQALIDEIVRQHADRYDLWDPTAIYARRPFVAFIPGVAHRPQ